MQSVAAALDIARGSLPPLQQELDIGGGWKRCWDAAAQENYYFHGQSDQAQWENPGNKEARSGECKDQDETTETGAVEWGEQERMEAEQRLRHPPAARTNLPKEGSGAQWARARHAQQEAIPFKAKKAQHLDLRHARLSTHDMIELKVALQTDSTLLNLGLGEASIGDAGATLLADALQHNTTLTALDLEFNRIEPPGAKRLAEALAVNSSLTKLKLEGNHICDAGATHLADALHSNSTLTALDLRWSSLKRDGVAKLAVVLMTNTTLTDLDLGGNEMGEAGVLEMAAALTKNTVLSRLELAGNDRGIDDACATKVVQALASNSTLTSLGLKFRLVGQSASADPVVQSFRDNSVLTEQARKSLEEAVATASVERRRLEKQRDRLREWLELQEAKIRKFMAPIRQAKIVRIFGRWRVFVERQRNASRYHLGTVQRFAIRSTWDAAIKRRAAGHLKDGHFAMSASEKMNSAPGMERSKIPALVAEYASAATKAIGSKSILTQQEANAERLKARDASKQRMIKLADEAEVVEKELQARLASETATENRALRTDSDFDADTSKAIFVPDVGGTGLMQSVSHNATTDGEQEPPDVHDAGIVTSVEEKVVDEVVGANTQGTCVAVALPRDSGMFSAKGAKVENAREDTARRRPAIDEVVSELQPPQIKEDSRMVKDGRTELAAEQARKPQEYTAAQGLVTLVSTEKVGRASGRDRIAVAARAKSSPKDDGKDAPTQKKGGGEEATPIPFHLRRGQAFKLRKASKRAPTRLL